MKVIDRSGVRQVYKDTVVISVFRYSDVFVSLILD